MKILIAFPTRPSFVARDINILATRHQASEHQYYSLSPANLLRGFRAVANADLLYLWFASLRALPLVLFARLLGKTVITVVGGYETANCPEINYGNARFARQKFVTRWILFHSRFILAVSASSRQEIINNLGVAAQRLTLIHHGFEDTAPETIPNKAKSVLTIGLLSDVTWTRKGVFEFIRCAELLPDIPFIHVGNVTINVEKKWGKTLPANLRFRGILSDQDLLTEMSSAQVYLQLSRHEAFGCSVAEAMLFRCVPVVSNRYALPEVVGASGYTVDPDDIDAAIVTIRKAIASPPTAGQAARERIQATFSLESRTRKLFEIIDAVRPANR